MTREEAIDRLRDMGVEIRAIVDACKHMTDDNEKDMQALDIAIKALEQEPCEDAISRKAAIDALRDAENHAFNSYYQGLIKAHKIIVDLPPVQPMRKPCEETNQYKKGYVDCARDVIDKINLNYSKHQLIDVQSLKDIIITTRSTIEAIDNVPIDNAVVIPEDATNGDVIKAAFGEPAKISESGVLYKIADFVSYIGYEWWNAPYNAESEVEECK